MTSSQKSALALFLAVLCATLLSYRGRVDSGDELTYFSAATSYARFGDFALDDALWYALPNALSPDDDLPLQTLSDDEQAVSSLISPFVALADALPFLGVLHSAFLFNAVVTALIGVAFFALARTLGYRDGVALAGALALCLLTGVGVYSKTLFREPSVTLFLLLAALACAHLARARGVPALLWGLTGVGALALAIAVKESALFAVPALLLLALPNVRLSVRWGQALAWASDALLLAVLAFVALMAWYEPFFRAFNLLFAPFLSRFSADTTNTQTALQAYLFSIGGSVWGTSPILLLAGWGLWRWRRARLRWLWAVVLMLLGYSFGHAYLTGVHWAGGLSWMPRFLVPSLPFLALGLLPALDALAGYRGRARLWWLLAGVVVLYGAWVNVVGGLSFLQPYTGFYPEGVPPLWEWAGGLYDPAYLRWTILPRTWGGLGYDTAWYRAGLPFWAWANVALMVACLLVVWRAGRVPSWGMGALLAVVLGVNALGMGALYALDPEHQAQDASLQAALRQLSEVAQEGDVLLLPDLSAEDFVLNTLKGNRVRPLVLPNPPGETFDANAPPPVRSASTPDLLDARVMRAIDHLALRGKRVFLLATTGDYQAWAVRPVERYLTENYGLVREWTMPDGKTRLLDYDMGARPYTRGLSLPTTRFNVRFGDNMTLHGMSFEEFDGVARVAFQWSSDTLIPEELVVGWFIVPLGQDPIQAMDARPRNGFASTLTWRPHERVWDKRALRLSAPIGARGELWVQVYRFVDGAPQRLPITIGEGDGLTLREGVVLIVPLPALE
jgi:hypothetical protein